MLFSIYNICSWTIEQQVADSKKDLRERRHGWNQGYAGLLEILESQLGSANVARQVLKEVQSVFLKKELTEEDEEDAVDPESKTSGGKNQL